MEKIFKVTSVFPLQQGTSERGEWRSQDIIVEAMDEVQYPDRFLLRFTGRYTEMLSGIEVGSQVNAQWSANVRKYTKDGKDYYSQELRCWKIGLAGSSTKEEEVKPF